MWGVVIIRLTTWFILSSFFSESYLHLFIYDKIIYYISQQSIIQSIWFWLSVNRLRLFACVWKIDLRFAVLFCPIRSHCDAFCDKKWSNKSEVDIWIIRASHSVTHARSLMKQLINHWSYERIQYRFEGCAASESRVYQTNNSGHKKPTEKKEWLHLKWQKNRH